jgi:hypothetical protein
MLDLKTSIMLVMVFELGLSVLAGPISVNLTASNNLHTHEALRFARPKTCASLPCVIVAVHLLTAVIQHTH